MKRATAILFCVLAACGESNDEPAHLDAGIGDASVDAMAQRPDGSLVCYSPDPVTNAPQGSRDIERDGGADAARVDASLAPSVIDALTEDSVKFPLGVQAGGMRADRAILFTRIVRATGPRLTVWKQDDESLVAFDADVEPDDGGYVHVTVSGLEPWTWYRYAFVTAGGDARSVIGRFKTALPDGALARVRMGATTCTGSESPAEDSALRPYNALSRIAEEPDVDFTVHLGDVSYNDQANTAEEFRTQWLESLGDPGYRALTSTMGWYVTWDDHEVGDNWDPETIDTTRLEEAEQTFYETLALETGPADSPYNTFQWGDSVEVFVLDLRSERRPTTMDTPEAQFIAPEQMDFLKQRLLDSTAHFKVVMSSVNISNLPGLWDIEAGKHDRWEGYAAQRTELLDFIVDSGIRNVWFLAGDIHMGLVSTLEAAGPYSHMWEITVGPGDSAANPIALLAESNPLIVRNNLPCDQIYWYSGNRHAATILDFDPVADAVHVQYIDGDTDQVLFDQWLRQGAPR